MPLIPTVIEQTHRGERAGTSSRACSRTASSSSATPIDDEVANVVIAQLLFLESEDPEKDIISTSTRRAARSRRAWRSTTPCSTSAATSRTICMGQAASMGAFLLAAGTKGKRYALPHCAHHDPPAAGRRPGPGDRHRASRRKEILTHARHAERDPGQAHRPAASSRSRRTPTATTSCRRDEAKEYGLIDEVDRRKAGTRTGTSQRTTATPAQGGGSRSRRTRDDDGNLSLLLLRQVAEGGEEADRRPDRLHLRRVHRPVQRHHRRGDRAGGAAPRGLARVPKPARDQDASSTST